MLAELVFDWAENLRVYIDFLRTLCGQIMSYLSEVQKLTVIDYVFEIKLEESKSVFSQGFKPHI